jgi:hypothetical protein
LDAEESNVNITETALKSGDRVIHPKFGMGIVTEDAHAGRVEVIFDQHGKKLLDLRYARLRLVTEEDDAKAHALNLAHVATFHAESPESQHFPGTRWKPFFDDPERPLRDLPEILICGIATGGFSEFESHKPPFRSPPEWLRAVYFRWPAQPLSLLAALANRNDRAQVAALYPYVGGGAEHTISLRKVLVWNGGLEAHIEAEIGGLPITFFDSLHVSNRGWYLAGDHYQFILAGIAYRCAPAESHVFQAKLPLRVLEIFDAEISSAPAQDSERTVEIHTEGMAALLPIRGWDRDDYHFRGPVRAVKPIEMLEQFGWMLRVTVLRANADGSDIDIDVVVTCKVWGLATPPEVGQDVEGSLWLQGQLWYPHRWRSGQVHP